MKTELLGKQVLPLPIDRSMISGREADKVNGGMGAWLTGDKAREHYKRAVDNAKADYDEDNVRMKWYVYAITADDTYTLMSEYGYERSGTRLEDFEVIKDGETW